MLRLIFILTLIKLNTSDSGQCQGDHEVEADFTVTRLRNVHRPSGKHHKDTRVTSQGQMSVPTTFPPTTNTETPLTTTPDKNPTVSFLTNKTIALEKECNLRYIGGDLYCLSNSKMEFEDAKTFCSKIHGELVTSGIRDPTVKSELKGWTDVRAWVGLERREKGWWYLDDIKEDDENTDWFSGTAEEIDGEDCGRINVGNMKMFADKCTTMNTALCVL